MKKISLESNESAWTRINKQETPLKVVCGQEVREGILNER